MFIGAAIVVGIVYLGVAYWMLKAQSEYFRLYRERKDPGIQLTEDLQRGTLNDPVRGIPRLLGSVGPNLQLLKEPQEDPILERARQEYQSRSRLLNISMVGALAFLALVTVISGR